MTTEHGGQYGAVSSSVSVSMAGGKTGPPELLKGLRPGHADLRRIIRDKLRGGVYGLGRMRRGQRRSAVWEHFRMVEDERGMSVGYAGCMHCLDVLRHDAHLSGTSSLFSHLRSCSARLDFTPSTVPLSPETNATLADVTVKEEEMLEDEDPLLTEVEQQEPDPPLLEACVDCLASDLLPPHTLHSAGFLRIAQLLLECGMQGGTTQALAVLPSQKQVAERVASRASKARQHLGRLVGGAELRGAALVLCEMPTQQRRPRALLLRTLEEWRLHTHFLGLCPPIAEAERQDPRAEVAEVLKKFQLTEAWKEAPPLVWSSEMRVGEESVVPCASHMLSRAVRSMLEAPQEPLPQVREYLVKCRDLARWAAKEDKGLAERLVMDDGDTRAWRRTLAMVESVCALGNAWLIRPLAVVTVGDAAVALLRQLAAILQPVRAAVADLEATHVATLHKVIPWLLHLKNACQPATGDEAATASMKAALREGLEKHATPTPFHNLAVFFNPRMSSLRILAPEDQRQVREAVLSMAPQAPQPAVQDDKKATRPLAYLEDTRPAAQGVEREVEMYGIMQQDDADPDDLLAWWNRNSALLPLLSSIAARVLVIPACTAMPTAATVVLEDLSEKLLGQLHDDPAQTNDLALLHARLAGL